MSGTEEATRVGEHTVLLVESCVAHDQIRKRNRASRDGASAVVVKPGRIVLGAVAVCVVLGLANGHAWRPFFSSPTALGQGHDDAFTPPSFSAVAASFVSSPPSPLSEDVGAGLGDHSNQCPSTYAARAKNVYTYSAPTTCGVMMVCAGSPRAASTAHCTIAVNVMNQVLAAKNERAAAFGTSVGRGGEQTARFAGYWNYHLHVACRGDVEGCELFRGVDGDLDEFTRNIEQMDFMDAKTKQLARDAMGEVEASRDALAAVGGLGAVSAEESVVVVKTHEFDPELMHACSKRLVLTSWRDKEQVFDSGLELGWFQPPKEDSRAGFDRVYDAWTRWRQCWSSAVQADQQNTAVHDLGFESLNSEDSFRTEVRELTKTIAKVLDIPRDELDVDAIVDRAVKETFHLELNPTMTNGNLPRGGDTASGGDGTSSEDGDSETRAFDYASDFGEREGAAGDTGDDPAEDTTEGTTEENTQDTTASVGTNDAASSATSGRASWETESAVEGAYRDPFAETI